MNPGLSQAGGFPGRVPHLVTEPVGWYMAVGVAGTRSLGGVLTAGAATGTVGCIRSPAVVAPASRHVVGSEGAVPVLPTVLVWLSHAKRGNSAGVSVPGS